MPMKNTFFEGGDFQNDSFKALIPKYYPQKYRRYIAEETAYLKSKFGKNDRILEAGVGIGRLIPLLAPQVKEFIGVDNAERMIIEASKVASEYENTHINRVDLEQLDKYFVSNYFTASLCLWNTLGNVSDEVAVLKQLSSITAGSMVISVYKKGTVTEREEFYKAIEVSIESIDEENEIFFTKSGLRSKSYSLEDVIDLANKTELTLTHHKILSEVMLLVELNKKERS